MARLLYWCFFFCNFNRIVSIQIISPLQSNFWHELLENHAKLESNFNGGWNGVWTLLSFYCRVYALLIAIQVIGIKCQQKSMWRKEKNWTRGQLFSFWVTTLVYFAILQRFSAFLCQNGLWRYHVIIMLPFCSKTLYRVNLLRRDRCKNDLMSSAFTAETERIRVTNRPHTHTYKTPHTVKRRFTPQNEDKSK